MNLISRRPLAEWLLLAVPTAFLLSTSVAAQAATNSASALGQELELQSDESHQRGPTGRELAGHLQSLASESGTVWRSRRDRQTGFVRFLFGGHLAADFQPQNDVEFQNQARQYVAKTSAMHGLEIEHLVDDRTVFLPLGLAGSTDKLTTRFAQVVSGVPVRGGSVNVLMDMQGGLLSVDTQGLPRLGDFDVSPTISAASATDLAIEIFRVQEQVAPTFVGVAKLVIEQESTSKQRVPALAWEIELRALNFGTRPVAASYLMAASGSARLISRYELIHNLDVFGNVQALVSPGQKPDGPSNPTTAMNMPRIDVVTSQGTFTTDENGDFFIPGVNSALSASIQFRGPFALALNNLSAEYSLNATLTPNVQNNLLMNPADDPLVTAEGNSFFHLTRLREYIVGVNPTDTTADFQSVSLVNQDYLTCNALFDGSQTNFFIEAGGCPNTSFSSVVQHEMGHFLNQLYNSGNAGDGFGEGAADIWSMFVSDDPVVGQDFFGPGTFIRSGFNSELFCGDDAQGCQLESHANGLPFMGAFWQWRENLNVTYGNTLGDLASDVLLNAWFNAYDDGQVLSIIEDHLLVLDDDNGNLQDGTPNFTDINDGFLDRGWPGFKFNYIDFAGAIHPTSSLDELGPYGVAMDLTSATGGSVASATLNYSVDGGPFQALAMPLASGTTYTSLIPGQSSPSKVEYYLQVQDDLGNIETLPADISKQLFAFRIGADTVYYADSFDGPTDNGWTHIQTQTQDDWNRDTPTGASGLSLYLDWSDPPAAFSPPNCWGNDLGLSGFNGSYQADVDNALFSPLIDLTGVSNSVLSFKRWLTVERGIFDNARIKVNGNLVWENDLNAHVLDMAWTDFEVDISAFADGNSATQIEFQLLSDGGLEVGGWNIDDLEILSHDATPTDCSFTSYGTGLAGVQGVPSLDTEGQPARIGNVDFRVALKNGRPNSIAAFVIGFSQVQIPLFGGDLLVLPFKTFTRPTDVFGQARFAFTMPNDPTLLGQDLFWQGFSSDPSLPQGWSITSGITMTICN